MPYVFNPLTGKFDFYKTGGGSNYKTPASAGTIAPLDSTYDNGTFGVGATLTNAGTQAAFEVDGISPSVDDRIVVKNQTDDAENGIYVVTVVGDNATDWILTRAADFNQPSDIQPGSLFLINSGDVNANTIWENTLPVQDVGTDPISFVQYVGSGDVIGPASSLVNHFASFDGTTGKKIQDSGFSSFDFLQVANNLSELSDVAEARTNLGLGALSTLDEVDLQSQVTGILDLDFGGTGAQMTDYSAMGGIISFQGTKYTGGLKAFLTPNESMTNQAQPMLYAKVGTSLTNVTGSGGNVNVVYDTIVNSVGTGYDNTTGIFTVPTSEGGSYLCIASVTWSNISAGNNRSQLNVKMGSVLFSQCEGNPESSRSGANAYTQQYSAVVNLSAGDTIQVSGFVSGALATVGILGDFFGQYSTLYIARLF